MSQRSFHGTPPGSTSSDTIVRSSSESDTLTTVALQHNDHGSSNAIADTRGIDLSNVYGDELDELPALAPMSRRSSTDEHL